MQQTSGGSDAHGHHGHPGHHAGASSHDFELRFQSLFHEGRALSFPCDGHGLVDLDALSERARELPARASPDRPRIREPGSTPAGRSRALSAARTAVDPRPSLSSARQSIEQIVQGLWLARMTRQELYELVWSEPLGKVAPRFGMSDRGMAGLCRRRNIPLPPRGYWAKRAAGRTVPSAPLPDDASGETVHLTEATKPDLQRTERPAIPQTVASHPRPAARNAQEFPPESEAATALDAELERVLAVAAELQRRQAVHQLLAAVAVRATAEPPEAAEPLFAWIAAVRWRLEQDDPMRRLLESLRGVNAVSDQSPCASRP